MPHVTGARSAAVACDIPPTPASSGMQQLSHMVHAVTPRLHVLVSEVHGGAVQCRWRFHKQNSSCPDNSSDAARVLAAMLYSID
jgi:hypothetical protein